MRLESSKSTGAKKPQQMRVEHIKGGDLSGSSLDRMKATRSAEMAVASIVCGGCMR